MKKSNKHLVLLLLGLIAFYGAFASANRGRVASLLQAKADFIPNRCNSEDMGPCEELWYGGGKYPACVCFWNGTCEFRDDKTRCQWCAEEGAASVNEGEKCPNLKKGALHICPIKYPTDIIGPCEPAFEPGVDVSNIDGSVHVLKPAVDFEPIFVEPPILIKPEPLPYHIDPVLNEAELAVLSAGEAVTINSALDVQPIRATIRPLPNISFNPVESIELVEQPELTVLPTVGSTVIRPAVRPILVAQPQPFEPEIAVLPAYDPTVNTGTLVLDGEAPIFTTFPGVLEVDPATNPILITEAYKQSHLAKKKLSRPVEKIKATQGCVCTEDGVCKKQKIVGWESTCDGDNVVAVVEDGACPKSSKCVLKAPADAHKCTADERASSGRMCPMFISLNGCICYKDGHCENQGTNACINCQNENVVSVSSSACDCV